MKHLVVITFPTIKELWQFATHSKAANKKINTTKMTLTCYCEKGEIVLAENRYKGQVIEVFTGSQASFTDSLL